MAASDYIRWLGELGDVASVGGKTALLGKLCSALSQDGMKVPEGFAITAQAHRDALAAAGAWTPLHQLLDGLNKSDVELLAERAAAARKNVYASTGGEALRQQIVTAYLDLKKRCKRGLSVAVRSSRFLFSDQPAGLKVTASEATGNDRDQTKEIYRNN